jgi:hypothetical protein
VIKISAIVTYREAGGAPEGAALAVSPPSARDVVAEGFNSSIGIWLPGGIRNGCSPPPAAGIWIKASSSTVKSRGFDSLITAPLEPAIEGGTAHQT